MGSFNINQVPDNIPDALAWCIQGIKILFRRTASSGSSTSGGQLTCLFDHYTSVGNVGTTETDLYSDTIAGGTLAVDGDKLEFVYSGTMAGASDSIFRVYFGGGVSSIYNSGAQGGGKDFIVRGYIIRTSSTSVRYSISLYGAEVPTAGFPVSSGEKTGLTLSDGNVLKVSVECTAPATPSDSVVAMLGTVSWISHA